MTEAGCLVKLAGGVLEHRPETNAALVGYWEHRRARRLSRKTARGKAVPALEGQEGGTASDRVSSNIRGVLTRGRLKSRPPPTCDLTGRGGLPLTDRYAAG